MRFSVRTDEPRTIEQKNHGKILHANVGYDLIVSSLQKSGIYAHDGLKPVVRNARGKGNGIFFAYADVHKTIGKPFGKSG